MLGSRMTGFRVNEPNVVYEVFGEEVILVNLDSGKYYSVSGTGPIIWNELVNGFGIEEIAGRIQRRYTGELETITGAVAAFVDRLTREELLVAAGDSAVRPPVTPVQPAGHRPPFELPIIENYDDMQDLLVLDPIHDVDASGWPVVKKISG
jgi:Coenzyme PQQ synthesis protein D (PqqD)